VTAAPATSIPEPSPPPVLRESSSAVVRLFPALRAPLFRLLWFSSLPSTLGVQMASVAIGYAAFLLSGSATALGGVSLATGLPMLSFALVGGVVADRAPRRLILIGTQTTLGLSAAAIAALALSGHLALWHLYVLGVAQGTAFAFNMPARQAFIAELVGSELLRSAISLNNATMNFARIAGPALAGGLIAVPMFGVGGVFVLIALMYAAALLNVLRLPAGHGTPAAAGRGNWQQLVAGLNHIRMSSALLTLLTLGFLPMFFGMPYQTLLPLFAERVHGAGAIGLGLMNAAVGVGALAGSLTIAAYASGRGLGRLQIMLGMAFGAGLVGFGLAPSFPLAVAALVLVGFAFAGYAAVNQTLVMEHTAAEFHGRVISVYLMSFGLLPLATFPEAWGADHIGGPAMITIAGTAVLAAVGLTALLVPAYRRFGDEPQTRAA
jgi:MFS family permease